MMQRWLTAMLAAMALTFATGANAARAAKVYEPDRVELKRLDGKPSTVEQVREAIEAGSVPYKWVVESQGDGTMQLSYSRRGRNTAVVRIDYDAQGYLIRYVSSERLKYRVVQGKGPLIHPLYNQWVKNLINRIMIKDVLVPASLLPSPEEDAEEDTEI